MKYLEWIDGGVTAPAGFKASGVHAGVKSSSPPDKLDLALIASNVPSVAAAVFTRNAVKAAPVRLSMERAANRELQAVVLNSGNANCCAPNDMENAIAMSDAVAQLLAIPSERIAVCSTGVIGQEMNIGAILDSAPKLVRSLGRESSHSDSAARAIMTTDTVKKEFAVEFELGGKPVRIGGIAKGSGMIHPNMGTLLSVLTTDCAISAELLDKVLRNAVNESFNRISVDGDTSTNDTCVILASGSAGNAELTLDEDYGSDSWKFEDALCAVCAKLAIAMAGDGEGATHLITCVVDNAANERKAESIAMSVIASSLVKSMIFGCDANWGRVLCAMGYSGETFDTERVGVTFSSAAGEVEVCRGGRGLPFDEALAKTVLSEHDVTIRVSLNEELEPGECPMCMCWGCDLTYNYVKINGDYRT
ncbi:MAG: bifunctional ornithine acetyltransferase/N-acetylglutamate synthase [Oscillospiraceae bacterium]|jgi:glutamate N-acetyltransferase/amino-acid N-acetyltransferase|nr:bifunctional ornithine acetyltransferase/N-acetylglutamate synthase [Oscillospiraceae bacterium]